MFKGVGMKRLCCCFCRSTTPEAWHQFSQYNKDRAEAEMRASVILREAIDATLAETRNELEAQRIATEFTYRKRVHEMERAEGELVWQEEKVRLDPVESGNIILIYLLDYEMTKIGDVV